MPRERTAFGQSFAIPTSHPAGALLASASRKDLAKKKGKQVKISTEDWQVRCWYFFDIVGEYNYACNWVGNLVSRAKLVALKNGKPIKSGPAADLVAGLFNGPQGQAEALRKIGVHLTVAGECYVIGEDRGEGKDDKWSVVSNTRIKAVGGSFTLDGETVDANNTIILRIWRPHPIDPHRATSSSRSVLPILAQIEGFTKRVAADIDSRLTGSGLLLVPSEATFPSRPVDSPGTEENVQTREGADGLYDTMIEAASIAIQDPASAAARVPLVGMMPGEQIAQVKHITFWSEFDAATKDLTTDAIKRMALGMDMPPEALTGTGDMNHWNAWQLEEAVVKQHTSPLLDLIVSALTEGYLWPGLDGTDVDEDGAKIAPLTREQAEVFTIGYDDAELRLRPNRGQEAIELYDRGELSAETMLRENGFNPTDDAMPSKELATWLAKKLAIGSGSATPDQLRKIAEALGGLEIGAGTTTPTPDEQKGAKDQPSIEDHPTQGPPNDGNPPDPTAAAEVLLFRALERAGNRLKNKLRGQPVPGNMAAPDLYRAIAYDADEVDFLLDDAWGPCATFGLSPDQVDGLDRYARMLLATRGPSDPGMLRSYVMGELP